MPWFKRSRQKRSEDSLGKFVWLPPKEVYYRLALEKAEFDEGKIPLDDYYRVLTDLLDRREKILYWSLIFFFSLFLFQIRALVELQLPVVKLDPAVLGYLILSMYAVASVFFANVQARIFRYQSLFEVAINRSEGAQKQHYLLKYPRAFSSLLYFDWISVRPRYMHPTSDYPIRLLVSLTCLLLFCAIAIVFMIWLLVSVTIELWVADLPNFGSWGKAIVCASWAVLIFSVLLPSLSFRKIKFEHYGLSELLERFRLRDPDRYRHFVDMIDRTSHGRRFFDQRNKQKL